MQRWQKKVFILWCWGLALMLANSAILFGQTAPVIGLHHHTPNVLAFTHARIVLAPGKVLEKGTLVVRDGEIVAVGTSVTIPPDAVVKDVAGKTIYPGLIDLYTHYGLAKPASRRGQGRPGAAPAPQAAKATAKGAHYWNPTVRPETNVVQLFKPDQKSAETFRKNGITAVVTVPTEGIFRGKGALALLADRPANEVILAEDIVQAMSFTKGRSFSGRGVAGYPGSLMGSI
ncbi:MAG: amidohydrolase, partial [Calditrichaeota bacterium]